MRALLYADAAQLGIRTRTAISAPERVIPLTTDFVTANRCPVRTTAVVYSSNT